MASETMPSAGEAGPGTEDTSPRTFGPWWVLRSDAELIPPTTKDGQHWQAEQQGSNDTGKLKEQRAKWPSWTMILLFSNLLTLALIVLLALQFPQQDMSAAAAAFDELLVNQSMCEEAAASAAARIEHFERLSAAHEANCKVGEAQGANCKVGEAPVAEKAYEDGFQQGLRVQAEEAAAAASASASARIEENVTDKGLQKADDRGAPGSPWIVGGARAVVRGLWYVIKVAATLGSLFVCIGFCAALLCATGAAQLPWYEAEDPLWFAMPPVVASIAALVALGVMYWSTISELFLEAEQQHSFGISLAACLTCMCHFAVVCIADEAPDVVGAAAAGVGMLLFEAAWICLAKDVQNQEEQQLLATASAVFLLVMAWLWRWVPTFDQAWEETRRPARAAVVHLVLCTLLAGCFFALFSSSMFTLEKEDRPPLFEVMMILWLPLFLAQVAMALINGSARLRVGLEDVLKAMLKAPRKRDATLLVGSLFFAPMCFFTMLHLQDAWQWLATTTLTLIGLLLAYVKQDWLKKPCW